MKTRLLNLWERIRTSLWFIPAWLSAVAAGLGFGVARIEVGSSAWQHRLESLLLYSGDIEGARLLLSTVAGSMITVAGVTFSATMVALSLASSQLGPRLLLNFMRDRSNQFVLGTFIATFLFCLITLALVSPEGGRIVAGLSATIAVLFATASLALLIYFIHHVSSSIHADHVIESVARELEHAIDRVFPAELGGAPVANDDQAQSAHEAEGEETVWARAPRDGYLQALDEAGLIAIAREQDVVLRVLWRPGHFVVAGEPLVSERGGQPPPEGVGPALAERFILGRRRTQEQDPEYGIHELVEVAVRALSPGVNDPYTAISCIDWLGAILCRVGRRSMRTPRRTDGDGRVRLIVDPLTFEGMLAAAFNQIRQNSNAAPAVAIRLLETLARIVPHLEDPLRREAVGIQAEMVFGGVDSAHLQARDRRDLEQRYREIRESLRAGA